MNNAQYLELFIEESRDHLQNINKNLLLLEQYPDEPEVINEVFRSAHNKGHSREYGVQCHYPDSTFRGKYS